MNKRLIIDMIALHLLSIFAIVLFLVSATLLYPIGNFADILAYLLLLSITGVFFIYKKPNITKKLFITTVVGTIITITTYILTTKQDWTAFTFIFVLLASACLLLLFLAIRFLNKEK